MQSKSCLSKGKACLYYQIKKCLAPCEGKITSQEYSAYVRAGIDYINNTKKLCDDLEARMHELAGELRFEEAGLLRDRR